MSIKTMALGVVVAAAAFAAPAQAQVWNQRGDVVVRSDDRIVNRSARTVNGVRCVDVQLDRSGRRRTERLCDWNRDGVYGNEADRRYEERRRNDSDYRYRNAGQRRAAEVHARNEARKREQAYEKRQRELLKERQKREQELLKERQKREREAQKRRQAGNGPVWQRG